MFVVLSQTIYPGNECEGAFDFKTNRKGDLNFKKGEVIKILQVRTLKKGVLLAYAD